MSTLILGSTGFLGRHVAPALRAAGYTVATAGRSASVDIACSVLDAESLKGVIREVKPEAIVNLLGAGLSDPSVDRQVMEEINTLVPLRLAHSIMTLDPSIHLIHAASSTELRASSGPFESPYSRTKAAGTHNLARFAQDSRQRVTILRIHNTYGSDQPSQRFVNSVIDRSLKGLPIALRYPDRVRDFIHVEDVAAAFVDTIAKKATGVCEFEVGTGVGTSLRNVARMIAVDAGADPDMIVTDALPDLHPITIANPEKLILRANTELPDGIRRVVRERREIGTDA